MKGKIKNVLLIVLFVLLAFMVLRYWMPIKSFFKGFGEQVGELVESADAANIREKGATVQIDNNLEHIAFNEISLDFGAVLAGEKFCGLKYDQVAIKRYIKEHVAADDMSFVGELDLAMSGYEAGFSELSESAKTAQCTQIERLAQSYGLIK